MITEDLKNSKDNFKTIVISALIVAVISFIGWTGLSVVKTQLQLTVETNRLSNQIDLLRQSIVHLNENNRAHALLLKERIEENSVRIKALEGK